MDYKLRLRAKILRAFCRAFREAFHRGILYLASRGMRASYRLRLAVGCWLSLFEWALYRWFAPSLGCEVLEAANPAEKIARKPLQLQPLTGYIIFSV
jgi:hypothetical protein